MLRRLVLVRRATRPNFPEDTILHSHRRENLKSYSNKDSGDEGIFNFAVDYAIRKRQENHLGLKFNGTHQLLAYADVNLVGDNIVTVNKNTETLIDGSKEVDLEVNLKKTKYMLVSRDQNGGQNRDINLGKK
jgi:hypothetical protein